MAKETQPKDGEAGWIMGFGMPKPDTVESVLAEMREHFDDDREAFDEFKVRLAAAHEREVARAEAAEGLLREVVQDYDKQGFVSAENLNAIDAHLSGAGNG